MRKSTILLAVIGALSSSQVIAQPQPPANKMPAEIGAAYGRLGRAIAAHDMEGVKSVWAEDFVVNSPNNTVLTRDEVIAAMNDDLLAYKNPEKHIRYIGEKPGAVVVMGYDTLVPLKGPAAGKQVMRPFTDFWMKRGETWMLVARQATIAAAN